MLSREEFQSAINLETAKATESGLITGKYVVDRYWEKPINNNDASTWLHRLGLTILFGAFSGPKNVLETFEAPPPTVISGMPVLETMYESTKDALRRSLDSDQPSDAFMHIARRLRIEDRNQLLWHKHFGAVSLNGFKPTYVRTLPLPRPMCDQLGMFSTEFVQRPDTGNRFPIRYSYLFKEYPIGQPDILHGVTFNRLVDESWPQALTQHVDFGAVALWGSER